MQLPEQPISLPENSTFLTQIAYGLTVATAAIFWIRQQFKEGKKDAGKEPPKSVILERAELADMEPVRKMVAQWGEVCEKLDGIIEAKADIEETRRHTAEMKAILDKLNRKFEIDEEVAKRLREEKSRRDDDQRDRRTRT